MRANGNGARGGRGLLGAVVGIGIRCAAALASVAGTVMVAGAVVSATPGVAQAQFGMGTGFGGGDSAITRKGYNAYVKILGLDADQKELAKDLFEGNRTASKTLQKEMQQTFSTMMEKARESGDWGAYQKEAQKIAVEFRKKGEDKEKEFFADLKALLKDDQLEKFVGVERHRRRETLLKFGLVSGMSADMTDALEQIKVDPASSPELKEAIAKYEADVDTHLKEYKREADEAQNKAMGDEALTQFPPDTEKFKDLLKGVNDAAKKVRDVNRDAAKKIMAALPEDKRSLFERELNIRNYPRIFREGHTEKSVMAAAALSDLDESQKASVQSLKDSYVRDLARVNQKWAAALDEKEEKAGGRMSLLMDPSTWMGGGGEDDSAKARKERKELDDQTLEKLQKILKEEQVAKLPAKTPGKGGRGFGGPMEDWGWTEQMVTEDGEE